MMNRVAGASADAAFGLGWALTRRLPAGLAQAGFTAVGDGIWRAHGHGVRRLEANLRRVRTDLDDAAVRRLSRAGMRSYLRYWFETFRLPGWSERRIVSTVAVENERVLRDAHAAGDGVVVALPHMANWDHAGAWACLTGMPLSTVAERLRPERLYDRFVEYRTGLGMEVLPLTGGQQPLETLLRRARAGRLICLVADRDLSATGVRVDLLDTPASLPAGPAMLARRARAVLLPVTLWYDGPRLRLRIHDPVEPVAGRSGVRVMTQQGADAFSIGIREHPEDWHMLQRVFLDDLS
jgi:KDO2-lipid IV(A) lauroyltransferase